MHIIKVGNPNWEIGLGENINNWAGSENFYLWGNENMTPAYDWQQRQILKVITHDKYLNQIIVSIKYLCYNWYWYSQIIVSIKYLHHNWYWYWWKISSRKVRGCQAYLQKLDTSYICIAINWQPNICINKDISITIDIGIYIAKYLYQSNICITIHIAK